jgi:hypothetical protein
MVTNRVRTVRTVREVQNWLTKTGFRRRSKSDDAIERWVGRDALKDVTRPAVIKKVNR